MFLIIQIKTAQEIKHAPIGNNNAETPVSTNILAWCRSRQVITGNKIYPSHYENKNII
jgi:hypothetical protein